MVPFTFMQDWTLITSISVYNIKLPLADFILFYILVLLSALGKENHIPDYQKDLPPRVVQIFSQLIDTINCYCVSVILLKII